MRPTGTLRRCGLPDCLRPGERAERAHRSGVQSEAMQYTSWGGPYPSTVVPAERRGHRGLVSRPIDGGGVQRPVDQRSTRGQGEARGFNSN